MVRVSPVELSEGTPRGAGYRHEALFYAGHEQFMGGTVPFIRDAVEADEPILVVLGAAKIGALRQELRSGAERVVFADMSEVGTNPARIIPAWKTFIDTYGASGRRLRGIGEPIWAGRSSDELDECERHEALLNLAFGDPDFWLLCPYDIDTLPEPVIAEARRNHPFLQFHEAGRQSAEYPGIDAFARPFDKALPPPPAHIPTFEFHAHNLEQLRAFVATHAEPAGLSTDRTAELVLAVNEVATNSLVHGGGGGVLAMWRTPGALVCEVRDSGTIDDPLAGRELPCFLDERGRGLWLANQLCELVQIRSTPAGSIVRLHTRHA